MSGKRDLRTGQEEALLARVRAAARQEQFLEVVSAEEARARFRRHLDLSPLPAKPWRLPMRSARVLAHDVVAPVDAPPFDRSNVDGFAVRAADTAGASDNKPNSLRLNAEVIACGDAPALEVAPGTRDGDRDRRRHPARRRRRGDDRADRSDRGECAGDRAAPRGGAGPVHLLCRLRHRARRNAAAPGHAHRLARDRHAGRLRPGAGRGGAPAERRRALDRR